MKPYEPQKLPLENLDYKRLLPHVGNANAELARYDGLLQGIVNPTIMLSPLIVEEAVLSSRIEGTQATVDEVYEHEAGIQFADEKRNDIQEIINYRNALQNAQEYLKSYPITLNFLCSIHKILLASVRGQTKMPGKFRLDQNWIGPQGCKIENASFVPPSPLQLLDHLEAWQHYAESDDIDVLIQTAILHAQFELLHPFKDGNGRIGRLLIPLFLYQKKRLAFPMFYLSSYLESHRDLYYNSLAYISRNNDWNGWIEFFLNAIIIQAQKNTEKVKNIHSLYESMKKKIIDVTHSQYAIWVLDEIFNHPIFKTSDLIVESKITKPTIMTIIRQMKSANILKELHPASGRRPAVLCFPELLNIAEGRKIV